MHKDAPKRLGFSFTVIIWLYTTVKTKKGTRVKADLNFKMICLHCYAFPSDESLFTWLPFDVIVYSIIMVVNYYSSLTYEHLVFR